MTDRRLLETLLVHAESCAREAGDVTLDHFGGRVADESKADGSPVTLADREAETLLRERVLERFPGHGFLGEEFGEHSGTDPIRWIVDPIDGTRSFMRGVPLFGVLIGIEVEGEAVVGVAHFPALDETVSAALGLGCRWRRPDGRTDAARVNGEEALERALLLTSDPAMTRASDLCPGWEALVQASDYPRSWGDAYGHALVATGRAEIMVDPILSPWDAAPLSILLSEAGGRFTDLRGRPGIHGGSGISTNGVLHEEALRILGGAG
jgi:histidinol-phosphatase